MPDDKDKKEPFAWRKTPDDMTPVEPLIMRRRSSKSMRAFGLQRCPACTKPGPNDPLSPDEAIVDHRIDCEVCWDPDEKVFLRKVTADVAIDWNQRQHTKR
jgi:hypothetical protein